MTDLLTTLSNHFVKLRRGVTWHNLVIQFTAFRRKVPFVLKTYVIDSEFYRVIPICVQNKSKNKGELFFSLKRGEPAPPNIGRARKREAERSALRRLAEGRRRSATLSRAAAMGARGPCPRSFGFSKRDWLIMNATRYKNPGRIRG
jgi:hypothetical protein